MPLGYGEVVYLCTPETYFIGGGFFSDFSVRWCAGALVRERGPTLWNAESYFSFRIFTANAFFDRIHQRALYTRTHSLTRIISYRFDPSTQAVSFPLPFSAPTEGRPQATRLCCCSGGESFVPTASSQTWALTRRRRLQAGRLLMRSTRIRFSWRPSRLR